MGIQKLNSLNAHEEQLSARLISERIRSGLTKAEIAVQLKISPQDFEALEKSPFKVPSHQLHALATVYGPRFSREFSEIIYELFALRSDGCPASAANR